MSVNSWGFPLSFNVTGGEVHDSKAAPRLINQMPVTDYFIGDKGCDSEALREQIKARGSHPIIPRKKNSKRGNQVCDS